MNVIRSQLFTLFLFLSTLVAAILIIVSATFSKTRRFRVAYWWARANLWMVRWMCGVDLSSPAWLNAWGPKVAAQPET